VNKIRVDAGPVSYHTVSRYEYASAGIQCSSGERKHNKIGQWERKGGLVLKNRTSMDETMGGAQDKELTLAIS
jgi:hypothetical protein